MSVSKSLAGILLIFFAAISVTFAQGDRSKLEKEKKATVQKISDGEKILKETEEAKEANIGQLNALNRQIENREALIRSMRGEVNLLKAEIGEINIIIGSMEKDLKNLKKEYAAMVYAANKAKNQQNRLLFLFSAKTFNQFFMRLKYMKQYSEARTEQVRQIELVKNVLNKQKEDVETKKNDQDILLKKRIVENNKLLTLKIKQKDLIADLSVKESDLKDDLEAKKKAVAKLDKLISDIIKAEIAANAKKGKSSGKVTVTPEMALISSSFAGNKKRIPWPVSKGFVSAKFGLNNHPVLKGVKVPNDGIDIQTPKNEQIRSVFDGKVSKVAFIPGMNHVVIIKHGEYLTVYARLKEVYVEAGQEIKAKDAVGEIYTDNKGISEMNFQVWKNYEKMNPESWLSNR